MAIVCQIPVTIVGQSLTWNEARLGTDCKVSLLGDRQEKYALALHDKYLKFLFKINIFLPMGRAKHIHGS